MTKRVEVKKPTGRPTLFKEEYTDQLIEYFASAKAYEERILLDKNGDQKIVNVPGKFPTLARFATMCSVSRDTLHEWANGKDDNGELKHPMFSDAYKRAKDYQESLLCEGTIANVFNAPFSIFTAKNILGWKDTKEIEKTINATIDQKLTMASQDAMDMFNAKIEAARKLAGGN